MAFDMSRITTRAAHKPPTMLVVAKEKTGKTCFCAGDRVENGHIVEWGRNKPIILWMRGEQGANDIPVAKNESAIETYEDLMDALGWLAQNEHEFLTVVIDSLTTLCEIIKHKVQAENRELEDDLKYNQYGKGNSVASGYHRQVCETLTWLRDNKQMTVLMTAHIKHNPKDVADPEKGVYSAWMADIPDAIWSVYARSMDVIGYADTADVTSQIDVGMGNKKGKVTSVNGGERYLFFKRTLAHPSGGRGIYGHLPDKIPFHWAAFENAVAETMTRFNSITNN